MKPCIILAFALSAFAAEPQPAKKPETPSIEQAQKTTEQLQKQVASDKAATTRQIVVKFLLAKD